jgi:hypothetical protein
VATRLVQSCSLHWICAAWFEFPTSHHWTEPSLTTALCRQLLAALDDAPAR